MSNSYLKFFQTTLSQQDLYSERETGNWSRKKDSVIEKIRNALEHIRLKNFESPYINSYCKEYVQPELSINDLWRVYKFDEEWCKLQSRKKAVKRLFEQCRQFQGEKILADPEAPIPEDVRVIHDEDIKNIDDVTTFEGLKDIEDLFKFYYSKDRDQIKTMVIKKKKESLEAKKIQKAAKKANKKKTKTITNEEGEDIEVTDDEAPDNDNDEDDDNDEEEEEEEVCVH